MQSEQSEIPLTIRLFGRFEARRADKSLIGLHLREGERILAFLLLRAGGEPVSVREIARVFWPAEANANIDGSGDFPNVRQALHALRSALGDDAGRLVRPHRGAVRFDAAGLSVDVLEFGFHTSPEAGANRREAVALYRGPLLSDWSDPWITEARRRFQRSYEHTLKGLALQARDNKNPQDEERWTRLYLVSQPADEESGRRLLRLLSASGRHAEALGFWDQLRDAVGAEKRALQPETLSVAEEMRRIRETDQPAATVAVPIGTIAVPAINGRRATLPSMAALPVLDPPVLETAGGAVPMNSRFYVERDEDASFHTALQRGDSIVLVKGARQVGKTSLLARGLQRARDAGANVVLTDFQKLNTAQLTSPDSLYVALASMIAHKLGMPFSPRDMLGHGSGPNWGFEQFFLMQILPHCSGQVIWAMDEADRLFTCPFGSEVFGLFRSWHNERALDPTTEFSRLTLAIAYATEAQLFITDLNQSPFNVGTRLVLADFTPAQIAELNERHGNPMSADALRSFEALVGGQPYLVRRGLNEAASGHSIDDILAAADSDEGIFGDHLRRLWTSLVRSPDLVNVLRRLLAGEGHPSADAFYRLRAAGILAGSTAQEAAFRCRLYAAFFDRQFGAVKERQQATI